MEPDTPILRKGYSIRPFAVEHRQGAAVGYALVEHERLGRFDPEHAKTLGIPEGPLWGKIHKGESVTLPDGRVIAPSALVGPTRPGRTVVLTGDTRPCAATIQASHQADLLVHEATFGDEEAPRAAETMHSTAREAGTVAQMAKVRTLVLTHFSARYSRDASDLGREAREAFTGELLLAKDGLTVDVPFRDAAGNTTAE